MSHKPMGDRVMHTIRLVVEGKSNGQISKEMDISYNNASLLVHEACNCCGIHSGNRRLTLAYWYLRQCSAEERDRILNGGRAG